MENSEHILRLEITIEQLIKERNELALRCATLITQNEAQAQLIANLRSKRPGSPAISTTFLPSSQPASPIQPPKLPQPKRSSDQQSALTSTKFHSENILSSNSSIPDITPKVPPRPRTSALKVPLLVQSSLNPNAHPDELFKSLPLKPSENGQYNALRQRTKYDIIVVQSCIKFPEHARELVTFVISLKDKEKDKEMWRVEKSFADFCYLDEALKANENQTLVDKIGKLPEKSLFQSHSPLKNDKRKSGLEVYLTRCQEHLINMQPLLEFLCSDIVERGAALEIKASFTLSFLIIQKKTSIREGYLIKKGKNFGGWRVRYFVLKHGILDSFDAKEGELNGSLKLKYCTVSPMPDSTSEEIRHALLITEYKKGALTADFSFIPADSKILSKYILCAENDIDRNDWLSHMEAHIQKLNVSLASDVLLSAPKLASLATSEESIVVPAMPSQAKITIVKTLNDAFNTPTGGSYDELLNVVNFKDLPVAPISRVNTGTAQLNPELDISRADTSNSALATRRSPDDNERLLSKPAAQSFIIAREKLVKRVITSGEKNLRTTLGGVFKRKQTPEDNSKRVFGVSLPHALSLSRVSDSIELPAVFYRCIEYLEYRKGLHAGLYRLSGSTATVQLLKEKFNNDVDYDLIDNNEMYDMHAVSGLLKLYLRELPEPLLTLDLHRHFMRVMEIPDRQAKLVEIIRLLRLLPAPNLVLLKALSGHLNRVVHSSEINKMTVRNISIVFSPTLNIPAGILTLFMAEYGCIFEGEPYDSGEEAPKETVLRGSSKMVNRSNIPSVYVPESMISDLDALQIDNVMIDVAIAVEEAKFQTNDSDEDLVIVLDDD